MTLLDKFQDIEIKLEDQVPEKDRLFCAEEDKHYHQALIQLASSEELCRQQFTLADNQFLYLHEKDKQHIPDETFYPFCGKNRSPSQADEVKATYSTLHYGWNYAIRDIYRLRRQLRTTFIKRIVDYFIKNYLLEIPVKVEDYPELNTYYLDWLMIIECIKTALGGSLDFRSGAVEQGVKAFQEGFQWSKPVQKGAIIEFNRFMWWNRSSSHEFDRWNNGKQIEKLDVAVSIFETEEVRANYSIAYVIGQKCSFDWYPPLNGEKVDSYKFYKNGKMQIKFKDAFLANQFMQRFRLNSINS